MPLVRRPRRKAARWTLPDLVDFETLLATDGDAVDAADRRQFLREIQPRLADVNDAAERRRMGLRLWLDRRRAGRDMAAGRLFGHALNVAGWVAFAVFTCAGMALVSGLVAGAPQSVHVVIFVGLTLLLPWLLFAAGALLGPTVMGRAGLDTVMTMVLKVLDSRDGLRDTGATVIGALTHARSTRRLLFSEMAGLTQRAAIGFNIGLILAFVACLLLFDVRFYWEATIQSGMTTVVSTAVQVISAPWHWLWPQAVPDAADIATARVAAAAMAAAGDGSWWRFLLMALLVWGLLARVVLLAVFGYNARHALARLDFQAPRHRALWRGLSAVERGEVAAGPADGALVLDVGGHGVTGGWMRGFLLRRLRVNPLQTLPVAVLDEHDEARADRALAAGPAGVVLLAETRLLLPRQVAALHRRLRRALGDRVPMTWLVFSLQDDAPVRPADADMRRWAHTIDDLRDPAAEVMAYDP